MSWLVGVANPEGWGSILLGVAACLTAVKGWPIAKSLMKARRRPPPTSSNGNGRHLREELQQDNNRLRGYLEEADQRNRLQAEEIYLLRRKLSVIPDLEEQIERLERLARRPRSRSRSSGSGGG